MKIAEFGVNRKGETSKLYTLENGGGMEIAVSDFGATLHSLMVLDRREIWQMASAVPFTPRQVISRKKSTVFSLMTGKK